jgi:hypothetical protein
MDTTLLNNLALLLVIVISGLLLVLEKERKRVGTATVPVRREEQD